MFGGHCTHVCRKGRMKTMAVDRWCKAARTDRTRCYEARSSQVLCRHRTPHSLTSERRVQVAVSLERHRYQTGAPAFCARASVAARGPWESRKTRVWRPHMGNSLPYYGFERYHLCPASDQGHCPTHLAGAWDHAHCD